MKKLLSVFLAAVMVLSLPAFSMAQGATYSTLYSGEVTTLNYLTTSSTNEFAVAANVIDTLVEYDCYGVVQPSLALSWETSEDALRWTFTLRQGVQWVDGTGAAVAEVTANDFVAAARYVLDAAHDSGTAKNLYDVVAGAREYYLGTTTPKEGEEAHPKMDWDTVGIKAIDDYTLEYTLIAPTPYFLSMTTYTCFMPVYEPFLLEKGDAFGLATGNDTILYNGAYYISTFSPQERRVYARNALGWDADNVKIDTIEYIYNKEATTISADLYLRGEVDSASIDSETAADWLRDPEKAEMIRPLRRDGSSYSYFYAFNFDPQFDAAYEPENWALAVDNEAFRQAIFAGLDRVKCAMVYDAENPESILFNTVTPPGFFSNAGKEYTLYGDMSAITNKGTGTFDESAAIAYRDTAKAELTAAGATFPIKVLLPYNPSSTGNADECQVVEQQLEALLGADFIDIIIEAGPSTGFLTAVRRSGNYALLKCNWGPDYADPQTYTDPFAPDNNYNFMDKCESENVAATVAAYYALVDSAKAQTTDMEARYAAFAAAESYLINHALIIPFGYGTGGYTASRLNPFEGQYAPFGISTERFKGQSLLDEPMSTDDYYEAMDAWEEAREQLSGN